MSSKYIKKYSIPPGFQSLLSEFTKEILRNQPKDIVDFAVEYFKCLQQGLILDYPHRGQNIPCDFKPAIPKIPDLLKNQINYDKIEEEYTQQKPQIGEKKEEEKKEEIIEKKKEKIIEEKKEEIKEEKKVMKDKLIQIEYPNIVEKEKKNTVIQTGSSVKNTLYENCIDFGEKEEILEKLKENPENQAEIEEYINTNFLPNKNINELVALLQKTIMSYYNTKGTEKESEYNTLREEVDNKIKVLKENNPLIDKDFESLDIKEAVNEFKNYGYYQRILKVYIYKLNHLYEENNELLDEISFFIFANHLKMITSEDHPAKVLEDKPYIERYFLQNFQLLLPEVYSFVLGINQYNEPETINLFSSFSFRKRELCHKFYIFYNIKKMGRQERKKSELLEKYLFISSPSQILEKMTTVTDDNKLEVFDSITEKLQQNFPAIWQFISRVVNIPIELVNSSFDIFMGFNTISREIILNYLKLGEEYKDIYDIFSGVKIDNTESNFSSSMDRIYFELKYIPELNYRNFCIYRNKLFNIPDSIKGFIMKFETGDWTSEEENLLKEYETKNSLNMKSIYTYLLIKNMNNNTLGDFLKKIKLIKDKAESEILLQVSEGLKEGFTLDSDEFIVFKNDYEKWKKDLDENILEYFKKENDEQKKEYFMSLKDNPDKVLLFNCIKIENNLTEEGDFDKLIEEYKQFVP
jgi:hypothetical protein